MTTEIKAYSATEAAIADLATKYKDVVYDTATETGLTLAKEAYKDINRHSIILENTRVAEKAASLEYGRKLDAEAKRIADQLDALRLPIKTMIEVETKRAKREADEKQRLAMEAAIAITKAREAEERAKIDAERAAIAKELAEAAEVKRKAQEEIEVAQRESRRVIEEQERAARLAREEADREARKVREAEEARLKAERDAIEAEKRKAEDAARKEREAKEAEERRIRLEAEEKSRKEREVAEAIEREKARKVAEKTDAAVMLATFKKRFGHMERFASVIAAIDAL